MFKIKIALFFSALLLSACKSSQPARPQEFYEKIEAENLQSTLNLPIRISRPELERAINQQMGNVLFEDNNLRDDGLMLKATKMGNITILVTGQSVNYKVPLSLWVRKDLAITTVDAEGALELEFSTNYEVKPDWTFVTKTSLSNYRWTRTPVVKLGIGNLNVTGIADHFVGEAKGEIATAIDDELKGLFDLKTEVTKAWKELQKPFLVSEVYSTWLLMNPTSVGMTKLATQGDQIQGTVVITAAPEIWLGPKPAPNEKSQLPDFQRLETAQGEDFNFLLQSKIPFSEAERIAKQNMVGETFTSGGRTVKVEEMEMYGQGNKLVVRTNLSGSYRGDVYLIGKPAFNARKNRIELEDVAFDFSSQKALMRTASWLFKGKFKDMVQDEMDFYLSQNLEESGAAIRKELELFELAPGMALKGELGDLSVSHVYVGVDALHVRVSLKGKLALEVNGIGR